MMAAIVLSIGISTGAFAADLDPQRVDQIAAMLSDGVFAFGPKITDRAAWDELGRNPALHAAIGRAERILSEPIPALPDDLFLQYLKTGIRAPYERRAANRTDRIAPLVLAECIEHRGRFIPAIEQLVAAFDQQKTWLYPAQDQKLKNFLGQGRDIDLTSASMACDLANAAYVLGDSISPQTRSQIDRNVRRRVLDPFRDMVSGQLEPDWWLTADMNWNAVCLANVLGTALATLPGRHDRAVFAAAAEHYSLNYLDRFAADGYCTEGLHYWNYGFGNYIRLCELLYQATGGRVDCFARDKVNAIADFPRRFKITEGVYPPYGDTALNPRPTPALVDFLARRFHLPAETVPFGGSLAEGLDETLMMSCPNSATGLSAAPPEADALRDWFPDGQVLTCRPAPDGGSNLAVSIKGGRNGASHEHCDLGSFVLVIGKTTLLADPGMEVYIARTFGDDRFKSKVINSFGHNVPLVAGGLQIPTPSAAVKILHHDFTDSTDALAMDLTSVYADPRLTRLTRTFTYDRGNGGSLTIDDECRFSAPAPFGIQFITFGKWKLISPTQLLVWQDNQAVQIDLTTDGGDLNISSVLIDEDLPSKKHPVHISVDLKSPSTLARVKSVIRTAAAPEP